MTIVRKKLYRVGFFPRFNVLSQLHSAKHFKFLQTMNTDRGRERGLEIEMCLLTFSQIMEVCLSWLEVSQHILLPIVDQTYPNASKHFQHISQCVSERSSNYIFALKHFRAPDGNRTHNLLITGQKVMGSIPIWGISVSRYDGTLCVSCLIYYLPFDNQPGFSYSPF